MIQYQVLTEKGKITKSEPALPINSDDLDYINNNTHNRIIDRLVEKMPGIVNCQIVEEYIDWDNDTVLHILTQT